MDWMNNKIYFTDHASQLLCVLDPVNLNYKVLVNTSRYPRSIVLDPISR